MAKRLKKARLLNDGLRAICNDDHYLSETLVDGYYHDVFAEIIRNDPKDVLGRGKELKEKKQEEKEDLANREIEAHIKSLATELNRLLEGPAPLATYFSAVDKFLEVHPEFPKGWPQQSALMGKVEAAIILRDYAAALKALDEVVSVVPDAEVCKKLDSTLRPELAKALKLSAAGTDTAVTAYAIRLNFSVAVDADGSQTAAELKRWSADWDMLLMEDVMSRMLGKIDTLLRLRDYEEALKTLDSFVQYGHSTGQVMRRDRELRPIILRGLNKKSANAVSPSGTKPDEHSNGSTR